MKKKIGFISILVLLGIGIQDSIAQQSIKRKKQDTKFHYLQGNVHFGYQEEEETSYFDLANVGPSNNLTYRFLSKNQRQLQKGYTNFMAINSFSSRISLQYKGGIHTQNKRQDIWSLRLQNLGLSFVTKWDRTTLFLGYNRVQFGHNPKVDPVSDFTINTTQSDLGFNQDAGVFFRTPISKILDLELGASLGGFLSKPLVTYTDTVEKKWELMPLDYQDTWLVTGRIGTPVFHTLEYGLIAMSGRLENEMTTTRYVHRVGVDVLKKFGEYLKISGQAVVGITDAPQDAFDTTHFNAQQNIEYYFRGKYIINSSHGIFIDEPKQQELERQLRGQWRTSLSYVYSQHTRMRLNHYINYSDGGHPDWGITFQLITGFGQR